MQQIPNTASASPEQAFVGIDPEDTDSLTIGGAKFEVRVLPSGLWDVLTVSDTKLYQNAQRKAIAKLVAEGRDPSERAFPEDEKSKATILDLETQSDQEYAFGRAQAQLEVIRFGVVKHENLRTRKGEIPFETEEVKISGQSFTAMTKKTLKVYEVNRSIRNAVYVCIFNLNTLGELAKKA